MRIAKKTVRSRSAYPLLNESLAVKMARQWGGETCMVVRLSSCSLSTAESSSPSSISFSALRHRQQRRAPGTAAHPSSRLHGDLRARSEVAFPVNTCRFPASAWLCSIKPNHRYHLACNLWLNSSQNMHKYSWLLHFIAPITRIHILLIIIDQVSHSPLVLMRVCELWYTNVTGIWV